MLVWSRAGRRGAWAVLAALFGVVYALPMAVIALASLAGQWNGVLPSRLGLANFAAVLGGSPGSALRVSLLTAALASALALLFGTCSALALRGLRPAARRLFNLVFFLPSAVPSVSVGLGLLVAFSRKPLALNGTAAIVLVAHLVLVSAFTYAQVSAGLARIAPEIEQMAESLGASSGYRLRRVTLPLLAPYLVTAFSLSFALSMGELGATIMVYPPGWVTMPVAIFALTDRGDVFQSAALTLLLAASTLAVLVGLSLLPMRAAPR